MPGNRNAVVGIALGSALLVNTVGCSQPREPTPKRASMQLPSSPPTPSPFAPPPEWAEYIAQVKAAEQVQGDEARCKAYPDLPGNQWRPGAAQGRCSLLRAPAYTLDQIDALLDTDEGAAKLERTFAALLDAHYRDQAQREQIFVAFFVFDETLRAGEVARRWAARAPDSAFAQVALGSHYDTAGWKARGTGSVSETPEHQFKRMADYFAEAIPAFKRAMKIEPRLSVACNKLSTIGRQVDRALQKAASSHCLKVDPDSYHVVLDRINAAMPRWGGSDAELRDAVAYAAARTERNPILGALLGDEASYRPLAAQGIGDMAELAAGFDAAVRLGVNGATFARAGDAFADIGDNWHAVALYSQSIRFWPNDPRKRYSRAERMSQIFHDYAWARTDMEIALKYAPDAPDNNYLMGLIVEQQETPAAARPYFQRAMQEPWRAGAMEHYCQSFVVPEVTKEANACTRQLVEEYPESAFGLYLRAKALAGSDVVGALAAMEQFRQRAIPAIEEHRRALSEADAFEAGLRARLPTPKPSVQ